MKHVAHQLRGQLHVCQGGSGFIVRVRASYFATTAVLGKLKAHYELGFWEIRNAPLNGAVATLPVQGT